MHSRPEHSGQCQGSEITKLGLTESLKQEPPEHAFFKNWCDQENQRQIDEIEADTPGDEDRKYGFRTLLGVPIPADLDAPPQALNRIAENNRLRTQGYQTPSAPPLDEEEDAAQSGGLFTFTPDTPEPEDIVRD